MLESFRTQFVIVMDKLADEVRQESPWTVTFVADAGICRTADGGVLGEVEVCPGKEEKKGFQCVRY